MELGWKEPEHLLFGFTAICLLYSGNSVFLQVQGRVYELHSERIHNFVTKTVQIEFWKKGQWNEFSKLGIKINSFCSKKNEYFLVFSCIYDLF
jgi:hypothetical protein